MNPRHFAVFFLLSTGILDSDRPRACGLADTVPSTVNPTAVGNAAPDKELALLETLARGGNTAAQYRLGVRYLMGDSVPRDEYEAFGWLRRAAANGHSEAQFQLGLMYLRGVGVTSDDTVAMEWLERAVAGGSTQAQQVLSYVLNNDIGYGC